MATDSALVDLRRDLHRHPEPAWREFYTTARLVDELETRPLDALHVGAEALADDRMAVPDDDELEAWRERAVEAGARRDVVERLDGGTGLVAVLERGEGPTVGVRVDIDALPVEESTADDHVPAAEGFRSENEGYMHACGHDAHATIGVGLVDAVLDSDFAGTLKVFFQPAEEVVGGGDPMARSGHLDDVDYFLAVHVGLDHPSGEVVAGVGDFLAVSGFRATYRGETAHAGNHPEAGKSAIQAVATAVGNLHAIPRHDAGATRVNAGKIGGGTASNIVAERAFVEGEVRGETTELMEYMEGHRDRILDAAARMHDCELDFEQQARAPSAESDEELLDRVATAASAVDGVESVRRRGKLGGSEDATFLMRRVQEHGGLATYVAVGTDHPGGHHTGTFDVREGDIGVAIDVLAGSVLELSRSG